MLFAKPPPLTTPARAGAVQTVPCGEPTMRNIIPTSVAALAIAVAALAGCDRDGNTSRNGGTGTPGAGSASSETSTHTQQSGPTSHPAASTNAGSANPGAPGDATMGGSGAT